MKCIDCKFCAFINDGDEEMTVKNNGVESTWGSFNGAYCMKTTCIMTNISECSAYKKSKIKKLKQ